MASGTYISTILTQSQMALMRLIDDREVEIFSLEDVKKIAGDPSLNINKVIENLVQKNILSRIERGKYCRSKF